MRGPSITLRVVALTLVSVVMMTIDHRQHHMDTIRDALSLVIYPVQFVVNLPFATRDWMGDSLATRRTLEEENRELRARQLFLESQLLKLESLEAENDRLRRLLDSSATIGQPVLIAELLAIDMAPFSQRVVLNKGNRHQVREGQPMVDASGVMGQVVQVTPMTSVAMLITDPSHAVPVEVNRNGLRAIARGIGDPSRLELSLLPRNADIDPGDLLVTSGLDGRFPPGYPVGRVTEIERGPNSPFARVFAEPVAHMESTRVVLLVRPEAEMVDEATEDAGETAQAPGSGT
jgi:rod shape-determining protein MreC